MGKCMYYCEAKSECKSKRCKLGYRRLMKSTGKPICSKLGDIDDILADRRIVNYAVKVDKL